jgi:hypothetical protein
VQAPSDPAATRHPTGSGSRRRPEADRITTTTGKMAAAQMPQIIPQISMYAFGRGRGAILIAQRYNHQMREHFLQYYEHLATTTIYQQHQQQIQQYEQFQDSVNELVGLPELIPIEDNFENIDED